jgi:nucleotide-binding universal stress UspA family protein
MYKHLLIATDGSEFAYTAACHGLELAKALGARATVMTVVMPWHALDLGETAAGLGESDYSRRVTAAAETGIERVKAKAKGLGVGCDGAIATGDHPFQEIVRVAKEKECDAIVMGSHGRRGLAGLIIGSVTAKVLTHSAIPVVVYRE